ncbi:hypothetical protein DFA_12149 [Cavenderia fasciculata]|uniref:DRBM domain-containing protein n=1 Tax=Cavenderia fasciculata TaxID=261658 RepID=F4QC96_CACFS|nr:uncharacterized protein DFA_12149 [Cavenderia fasciculata]EGG14377.1 hypothetical protein DFA_12149 [Cavenderia fasciculata]|eukprot:XP_004353786.1 hypothetical protein DFA_12149 [Cavenderia fasciculata]
MYIHITTTTATATATTTTTTTTMSSQENYKGVLQELCQKTKEPVPIYSESVQHYEGGQNLFTSEVKCSMKGVSFVNSGKGKTKKEAEKNSAFSTLQHIFTRFPDLAAEVARMGTSGAGGGGGGSGGGSGGGGGGGGSGSSERDRDRERERDREHRERERDRGDRDRERERDREHRDREHRDREHQPRDWDAPSSSSSSSMMSSTQSSGTELLQLRMAFEASTKHFTEKIATLERRYTDLKETTPLTRTARQVARHDTRHDRLLHVPCCLFTRIQAKVVFTSWTRVFVQGVHLVHYRDATYTRHSYCQCWRTALWHVDRRSRACHSLARRLSKDVDI